MNLKVLTLIIFTFLFFSIKINASPAKMDNSLSKKQGVAVRKSSFIAFKTMAGSDIFPNRLETKITPDSKSLSLKADFWFASFAIGSLTSMWLIKSNKG